MKITTQHLPEYIILIKEERKFKDLVSFNVSARVGEHLYQIDFNMTDDWVNLRLVPDKKDYVQHMVATVVDRLYFTKTMGHEKAEEHIAAMRKNMALETPDPAFKPIVVPIDVKFPVIHVTYAYGKAE